MHQVWFEAPYLIITIIPWRESQHCPRVTDKETGTDRLSLAKFGSQS